MFLICRDWGLQPFPNGNNCGDSRMQLPTGICRWVSSKPSLYWLHQWKLTPRSFQKWFEERADAAHNGQTCHDAGRSTERWCASHHCSQRFLVGKFVNDWMGFTCKWLMDFTCQWLIDSTCQWLGDCICQWLLIHWLLINEQWVCFTSQSSVSQGLDQPGIEPMDWSALDHRLVEELLHRFRPKAVILATAGCPSIMQPILELQIPCLAVCHLVGLTILCSGQWQR